MKKNYLIFALFLFHFSFSQEPVITVVLGDGTTFNVGKDESKNSFKTTLTEVTSFSIKTDLKKEEKLQIKTPEGKTEYSGGGEKTIPLKANVLNKQITLEFEDPKKNPPRSFRFIKSNGKTEEPSAVAAESTTPVFNVDNEILKYIETTYFSNGDAEETPFGLLFKGEKKIHIFIDYMGNNILGTIPQGISNAQYEIHVLYPYVSTSNDNLTYSIKQKTGTFSSSLNFRNQDFKKDFSEYSTAIPFDAIAEKTFILGTATDNITFDLKTTSLNGKVVEKNVIENFTINMSPTYHGSFDVGLIKTDLNNPTFNLVDMPDGSGNKTVKTTDSGSKGVVTVMATFYYSPVILFRQLVQKKDYPFYKKNGRNFLDGHEVYERFYPTIGVGLSDKVFENIFFGMNWELVRGLAIFGGWHYGKVRTFDMPNFQDGVPVTAAEFDFYQNNKWKTSTAFGIKLDLLVFKGLFGK